ncbi:MAG: FAD-dependent oxidoreductase [Chloroflexi bacterium]|nr:FAD-dependent oxidoreductase [Chloroflexota bacterium]
MSEFDISRCHDVLVIGAGIAGLTAARRLQQQGYDVLVLEKNQRVGGRMITEHIGTGWADLGAQFFTVREEVFQTLVDQWLAEGLIFEWAQGWSDGSLSESVDGYARYAAYEGLTAVPRRLAQNLPVHKSVTIESISLHEGVWQATAMSGETYQSTTLILTPPVPQSLAILAAGNVALAVADEAALSAINYAPCISGLLWVDGDVNLPPPGVLQRPNHPISWIADNYRKGISKEARILTLHVNPVYSRLWWHSPDVELEGGLRQEIRPYLAPQTIIKEIQIYRWPYAVPTTLYSKRILVAANLPPLVFAGDAFNGPRVEGAVLSGLAAADAVAAVMTTADREKNG